jgi:hypothetical protein
MAVVGILLAGAVSPAGAEEGRQHLGRGIARDGDRLIVADPAGDVSVNLEGRQPLPNPPAGLIVLRRDSATGGELKILDRRGSPLGTIEIPQAWTGFATDAGVILVPQAPHEARRPHWLKFLSHTGELRAEVVEGLTLVSWAVGPDGGLATVSEAPGDGTAWVILGYDRNGTENWRHEVKALTRPTALLTAGAQLVVLESDLEAGVSTVTIIARGRAPKSHRLWNITQMVADPDSSRVAAVGQETVALFDARTRRLLWRRDEHLDFVLRGGLRFDRRSARLLVVHAERDRPAGKAQLKLRSYRLSDGDAERAALGVSSLDELPSVVDVETPPEGGRRVLLHDRAVTAVPESAQ